MTKIHQPASLRGIGNRDATLDDQIVYQAYDLKIAEDLNDGSAFMRDIVSVKRAILESLTKLKSIIN